MERRRRGAGIGLLVVLGLALGARGCGSGESGTSGDGQPTAKEMPTAETTAVTGEDRATVAGQALGSIGGFSVGLFERSLVGGDLRACAKVTGDVQDSDEDGIPNNATLQFDGCFAETGFGIGAVTGVAQLRDVSGGTRDGLFEADLDLRIEALETEPFDWSSATTRIQGTLSGLGRDGDGAAIAHFLHIRIDLEREGKSHTVESDTRWRVSYDPIGTWRPGEQPGPGDYWIEGRWRLDVDGERELARIETRDPLAHRDFGCPFPCDDGALAADLGMGFDDDDPTIVFIWTGCNSGFVRVVEDDDGWDGDDDDDWDHDDWWDHHGDDDDWDHHGDDDDWDHDDWWDHHGDDDDDWDHHGDDDDDGWDGDDDDDGWDGGGDDDDGWDGDDDDDGWDGGGDDDDSWDGGDDDDDAGSPSPPPTSSPTVAPTGTPTSTPPVSTPEEPEETPTSTPPVNTPEEPEETPTTTPVSSPEETPTTTPVGAPGEPEEMPTSSPIGTPEAMPAEAL